MSRNPRTTGCRSSSRKMSRRLRTPPPARREVRHRLAAPCARWWACSVERSAAAPVRVGQSDDRHALVPGGVEERAVRGHETVAAPDGGETVTVRQ